MNLKLYNKSNYLNKHITVYSTNSAIQICLPHDLIVEIKNT